MHTSGESRVLFFASPLPLRTHTFSRLEFSSVLLNMVVVSVDPFFFWMDVISDRKIGSGLKAATTSKCERLYHQLSESAVDWPSIDMSIDS